MAHKPLTYSQSGVDYSVMDPLKRMAQSAGKKTAGNLIKGGFAEVEESRGESAYVVESDDSYLAIVEEGLGTKNLVADAMRKVGDKTYYDGLAQDAVAMIVNDLITVGAQPVAVLAYWAVGSAKWFEDKERMEDLTRGWAAACDLAGASWGGGETPTLTGVIEKNTIDLAGAGFGIVKPKSRLTLGRKLGPGDAIVVFESSGIHANGLTLARRLAEKLPEGYKTRIPVLSSFWQAEGASRIPLKQDSGQARVTDSEVMYGEALLAPTIIYSALVQDILDAGIGIHYMANITGHGWRKLMRHKKELIYRVTKLPPVPEVIQFICEKGPVTDEEAYANFNMGAGFAVFLPQGDVERVTEISEKHKIKAYDVGRVEEGEKQVILEPKNIVFEGKSLKVRS